MYNYTNDKSHQFKPIKTSGLNPAWLRQRYQVKIKKKESEREKGVGREARINKKKPAF